MFQKFIDLLLYMKYHFYEVKITNGSNIGYKLWAMIRMFKVILSGREKNKNYLLPFDTEIKNDFGYFFIPKNSDLVLTLSSKSEANLLKYFSISEGKIFLDIGANAGKYSIYLARKSKNNNVYAFEPSISTFNLLKKNIELNNLQNQITIFNIGLSNKKGNVKFYNYKNSTGLSFIPNKNQVLINEEQYEEILIDVDSLDNIVQNHNINPQLIDLIKIDVEGHEKNVIAGSLNTLKSLPWGSRILIEIFPHNTDKEEIINMLISMQFVYNQLDSEYFLFHKKV